IHANGGITVPELNPIDTRFRAEVAGFTIGAITVDGAPRIVSHRALAVLRALAKAILNLRAHRWARRRRAVPARGWGRYAGRRPSIWTCVRHSARCYRPLLALGWNQTATVGIALSTRPIVHAGAERLTIRGYGLRGITPAGVIGAWIKGLTGVEGSFVCE